MKRSGKKKKECKKTISKKQVIIAVVILLIILLILGFVLTKNSTEKSEGKLATSSPGFWESIFEFFMDDEMDDSGSMSDWEDSGSDSSIGGDSSSEGSGSGMSGDEEDNPATCAREDVISKPYRYPNTLGRNCTYIVGDPSAGDSMCGYEKKVMGGISYDTFQDCMDCGQEYNSGGEIEARCGKFSFVKIQNVKFKYDCIGNNLVKQHVITYCNKDETEINTISSTDCSSVPLTHNLSDCNYNQKCYINENGHGTCFAPKPNGDPCIIDGFVSLFLEGLVYIPPIGGTCHQTCTAHQSVCAVEP